MPTDRRDRIRVKALFARNGQPPSMNTWRGHVDAVPLAFVY